MGILLADNQYDGSENKSMAGRITKGKPNSDPLFDGWLTHHLSRLYDPVINEPIPADLLKLLEEKLG
jgi:hypothetical protein